MNSIVGKATAEFDPPSLCELPAFAAGAASVD
jgi:hypothetical protein